jgi:hypothetical protein
VRIFPGLGIVYSWMRISVVIKNKIMLCLGSLFKIINFALEKNGRIFLFDMCDVLLTMTHSFRSFLICGAFLGLPSLFPLP